ncbi:MAG: hypothetical protein PHS19_04115 [Eubacteriales bacterium]|nr:hypothetical protein [Eubacteriales bacterium]
MSTSIVNLRRLAQRNVKEHVALFDLYVTLGRDIDYLSIKFGISPDDLINLLEGYGEKLRITAADVQKDPELQAKIMEDKVTLKAIEEFGLALDYSGKGRYKKLSRLLVKEYVERFYPGIASESPENDWICLEAYLARVHPGWQNQMEMSYSGDAKSANALEGEVPPKGIRKRKERNTFKLF